jgi:hypothetical protein
VILSNNDPIDVTDAHCYCGSPINKLSCDLCKPQSSEVFTYAIRLPKFPAKNFLGARTIMTFLKPEPSSSPPWSLHDVIESSSETPCHHSRPRLSPLTRRHLPRPEPMRPSTMHALSPSPQRRSRSCNNVVLPKPMTLCT